MRVIFTPSPLLLKVKRKIWKLRNFSPRRALPNQLGEIQNSERPIANQVLQNKDRLRAVRSPSLSPSPSKDEEMEDSVTVRGSSSYGMRGALPPGQDKQVRFETQDDGVYDRLQSQRYQQKTALPPKSPETTTIKSDWLVPKETIPIKMAEGKDRFQVGAFLDTPVTLPMWQLLDRSPST